MTGQADSYYNPGQPQAQGPPPQAYANGSNYQGPPPSSYPQPPPNYGANAPYGGQPLAGDGKQTFEQTFKLEKPKYNDLWAGLLLILTFLGFTAVSALSLQGYATNKAFSGGGIYNAPNDFSLNTNTVVLFAFVLAVAFAFSWLYLTLARAFTKQFIWITGILQIVFGIGTAIYYFSKHYWSAAIVFALFGIFSIICFISWIPRIPFSVVMLQQTMDVAKSFGHVFSVSAIGGIVALAFGAWFSVTLVAVHVKYQPDSKGTRSGGRAGNPACSSSNGSSCSSAKVIGLIVFITFAGYWITEWIKNTMHSTVAGIYGSWFFCSGKPGGMPSGATRGAFRRAMTYSFGSISLGSLVVALINMLRQAVSIAQRQNAQDGNIVASIAFCVLGCLVSLLEWAVRYINRYAFSHIALYGKAYIPAAKDTWKMMKDRGIDALVNDCLIGPVLTMGSTFVGYLCALLAFLYLQFTSPAYNDGGSYTAVILAFSFLIGLQVCQIFMTPIGSGADTIFVAAAWDPDVLMRDHPDFYAKMISNLLFEILKSTATKREAKSYLSRFSFPKLETLSQDKVRRKSGVDLESLLPLRAVDENPVFTHDNSKDQFTESISVSLHVALVKIRAPQELDDATLLGVGHTLSQLTLLGLSCVVIVDCNDGKKKILQDVRRLSIEQADRVVGAIDCSGGQGARRLDDMIELSPVEQSSSSSVKIHNGLNIAHRKFLLASLQRGVIPVIVPNGFMSGIQAVVPVDANEVLLALSREFAGIQTKPGGDESPHVAADKIRKLQAEVSLDRIILLDPLGGIPSFNGYYDSHLFINLEQEYSGIRKELSELKMDLARTRNSEAIPCNTLRGLQCNENEAMVSKEKSGTKDIEGRTSNPAVTASTVQLQLENLELLRQSLIILPPSASALLTTANEAANVEDRPQHLSQTPGVGTRRQRNPLIYNLLTDKPVFSSSLPSARSQKNTAAGSAINLAPSPATFVKRGMPLTILPDPSTHPWCPPVQTSGSVQLLDARLDLARLVHLIEDSFSRQLDVPHYMSRIGTNLAGIIVAGEYEGGALLTWETPPRKSSAAKKVPYLDKFAVLKRSQGAGGVADIVFNAMVRNCFPDGVCWRSRTDNPVNKWYFERANGSWKIPGSNWTMFWTTDRVEKGDDTFMDYEAVCRSVMPSWADKKAVVD